MPDKSLGQHWLFDDVSLEAVVDGSGLVRGDMVLEVGPGLGTLTDRLLQRGATVTAVEFDPKLAKELAVTFEGYIIEHQLTLVHDDILRYDLSKLPAGYRVAANIPYYLTSNLIRTFCESVNPPKQMSLLVQKEVAERVAAKPGQLSLLSVSAQLYYEPSLGPVVEAELFTPPPKVDSQVLILKRRQTPLFPDLDEAKFFALVKAGFSERRKKLRSSLSGGLRIDKNDVATICSKAGIDPNLRAQALSLEQWYVLYKAFSE